MPKLIKIFVNAIFQSTVISISYYKIFCSNKDKCGDNCKIWCPNEENCCCNGKICCFKLTRGNYFCCLLVLIVFLLNVIPIVCFYWLNAGFYLSFLVTIVASFVFLQICLECLSRKKSMCCCLSDRNGCKKNSDQTNRWKKYCCNFISINLYSSAAFWIAAIGIFIFMAPTDWKSPASKSRERNHECVVGIYDGHDIWHILSSIALFLSFMFVFCNDKIMLVSMEEKKKDEESIQTNGRSGPVEHSNDLRELKKNDETEERKKLNETGEIGTST